MSVFTQPSNHRAEVAALKSSYSHILLGQLHVCLINDKITMHQLIFLSQTIHLGTSQYSQTTTMLIFFKVSVKLKLRY